MSAACDEPEVVIWILLDASLLQQLAALLEVENRRLLRQKELVGRVDGADELELGFAPVEEAAQHRLEQAVDQRPQLGVVLLDGHLQVEA